METGVLYKSFKQNFPAIDMMFKSEDGFIYGIHVTRKQDLSRKITTSAVDEWLDVIDLKNAKDKVRIAVIPKPNLVESFKAEYEGDASDGYPELEVWKVPLDYGRDRRET
jgi:hypothetical protein